MTDPTSVIVPAEVRTDIEARQAWAKSLVVTSPAVRTDAMEVVRTVKQRAKTVVDSFEASCRAALLAHRTIVAQRDGFLKPLAEIEAAVKAAVARYDAEQAAILEAQRRKLQAEADEKARKEQARLDSFAAAQREKEAAARRAEEEARRKAQEATNEADRIKAQAEAEKARKQAETAAAAASVREEAAANLPPAPVVTLAPVAEAVKGESKVTTWTYRIIDPALIPRDYLAIDEKKIGAVVRATKGTLQIPGIEIYSETSSRLRA
jgi:septal ring factor EnvC (AmiA/AmiB activator)